MKHLKHILGTLLIAAVTFVSCSKDDDNGDQIIMAPTAEAFADIRQDALDNLTQNFQLNTEDGSATFTSEKGVSITIQGNCLTLNGDAVTGQVDIKYIELFEKGTMFTTNKPTMGILPNGDRALLISGGEFLIEATQNGDALATNCGIQLQIPTNLTGGDDPEMTLWNGVLDENDDLAWDEKGRDGAQGGELFNEGGSYYAFFNEFGWSNVDKFYSDPRPKTTILVGAPENYDNTNSAVYLSYDGEDTGLAKLDTYDPGTGLFSEHYGQIPVGLECHIIFATEDSGNWRYAIKSVTISANAVYTFTYGETAIATEAELTALINGLP